MLLILFLTKVFSVSTALQQPQSVGSMVVFATRSRHTYGFESSISSSSIGSDHFDLPLLEFQALFRGTNNNKQLLLELQAVDNTSDNLFWAVPKTSASSDEIPSEECLQQFRARVAQTASRAVLTHASFDVRLSIPPHHSCQAATMAAAVGCVLSLQHTEVVDMRNPNLSIAERQALLMEAGVTLQSEQENPENIAADATNNVLLRRFDGHLHVGYRTGTGLAAPTSGAPGIKPRRNYKGILGKLALKNRLDASKHLTSTAMEPEIAIVMANLGTPTRISRGSGSNADSRRVLDPCCGSCSLLIAAAACGATSLVGVDLNATAFLGADMEFERHGLPSPLLLKGSVLEPHTSPAFNKTYHTILCDPPYGIGAPVLHSKMRRSLESRATKAAKKASVISPETIVSAVVDVARRSLVVGGRLVMFVPVRGRKDETLPSLSTVLLDRGCSSEEVTPVEDGDTPADTFMLPEAAESHDLRLVHGRRQCFSPTFSRWLVVMEKVA